MAKQRDKIIQSAIHTIKNAVSIEIQGRSSWMDCIQEAHQAKLRTANLILTEVLVKAQDEETIKTLSYHDPKMLNWVLANFIDLYIDGSQKNDPIPAIFKASRAHDVFSTLYQRLKGNTTVYKEFKKIIADPDTLDSFNDNALSIANQIEPSEASFINTTIQVIKRIMVLESQGDSNLMHCIKYAVYQREYFAN